MYHYISNRILKLRQVARLGLCTLFLIPALPHLEAQDYFRQYQNTPIEVINQTGGGSQRLILKGREGNNFVFDIPGVEGAMTEIPVNTPNLRLAYAPPEQAYSRASDLLRAGATSRAIDALRPIVYPLFQYTDILKENQFDGFNYIGDLYSALVRDGKTDEAMEILRRLKLNELNPIFTETSFALARKYIEQGKPEQTARVLLRIPFGEDNTEYLSQVMAITALVRDRGGIRDALAIYQRIQDIKNQPFQLEATLWCAYLNFRLDNPETARLYLDSAGTIERTQREYSLARLIEGQLHLANDDKIQAMDAISQGVVFSEIGYNWMPELLYTSAQCYQLMDRQETAKQIYGDIILFFPDSSFAELSREAMKGI